MLTDLRLNRDCERELLIDVDLDLSSVCSSRGWCMLQHYRQLKPSSKVTFISATQEVEIL